MSKSTRSETAKETLRIIEQGYYENKNQKRISIAKLQAFAVEKTTLYRPEELNLLIRELNIDVPILSSTKYEVTGETTLNAVRRLTLEGEKNILCLNFASAKNPGGGFLGGAQAQEESIARSSGLYPTLLLAPDYYETNRKNRSCLYTDHMIYSPKVPIFKLEDGTNMDDVITCSVITAPAVNTGVIKRNEPQNILNIEPYMRRRIEMVLALSLKHGYDSLVLGAWGCGVFQNDPREIALWFEDILKGKYRDQFKRVVFAVYARNERFIRPFRERFEMS
ncbi:MAG: TIGR02452 family protein [Bacteroidetes bacterium]|nr:TIGR02452 family protein [Bacteroidota bacterium]